MAKLSRGKVAYLRTLYNHRYLGTVTAKNLTMLREIFGDPQLAVGERLLVRDLPMSNAMIKALG